MRIANTPASSGPWRCPTPVLMVGLVVLSVAAAVRGDEPNQAVVGTNASPAGALLAWDAASKTWKAVAPKADITAGQQLTVLAGDRALVDAPHSTARLTLWGNVPQVSTDPLRDSAVVLNQGSGHDFSLTLKHGRAVVTNTRQSGAVKVQLRFDDQSYSLTLNEPGTEVAAERYSRWPQGIPFVLEKPGGGTQEANRTRPLVTLVVLVLKGQADVSTGEAQFAMHAPPGPAAFAWDNFRGPEASPRRVNAVPLWAKAQKTATIESGAVLEAVRHIRQAIADKPVHEVLTTELKSSDKITRDLAVDDLAAISDVAGLVQALTSKQYRDVREAAVEALRRWIGRGANEDQRLYRFLVHERKYSPVQAEIALQLLHSFDHDAWYRPETYELLIGYLNNPKMAIRVLAAAHLYRSPFAPKGGKQISYSAAGTSEERSHAVEQWQKLIPEGHIPKELQNKGS